MLLRKANAKHPVVLLQVLGGTLVCRQRLFNAFTSIEKEGMKILKKTGTSSQSLLSFTIVVFHVFLFQPLDFPSAVSKLHLVPVRCQEAADNAFKMEKQSQTSEFALTNSFFEEATCQTTSKPKLSKNKLLCC